MMTYFFFNSIECAMMFRMIMQLWHTNTQAIVLCDADLTETPCISQWILEQEFMHFAGKLVY